MDIEDLSIGDRIVWSRYIPKEQDVHVRIVTQINRHDIYTDGICYPIKREELKEYKRADPEFIIFLRNKLDKSRA